MRQVVSRAYRATLMLRGDIANPSHHPDFACLWSVYGCTQFPPIHSLFSPNKGSVTRSGPALLAKHYINVRICCRLPEFQEISRDPSHAGRFFPFPLLSVFSAVQYHGHEDRLKCYRSLFRLIAHAKACLDYSYGDQSRHRESYDFLGIHI